MPRAPRLDYPGALHHVIVRGIERTLIFEDDYDRRDFLGRLLPLVSASGAALYAWALMRNHAHVLLRTGDLPLSSLAQSWLGSYAGDFNRRHQRVGYLFQGRFKSILVEEEGYLLELVRYIHLNPVRVRSGLTIEELERHPWAGHAVLLGNSVMPQQDTEFVLRRFGATVGEARRAYVDYVRQGCDSKVDLDGGGLRRSTGGWEILRALARGRERWSFDERVLGGSDFVTAVLRKQDGAKFRTPAPEPTILVARLCAEVALELGIRPEEIASRSLRRRVLAGRAIVSHIAVCHHGLSLSAVGRGLGLAPQSVSRAIARADSAYVVYNLGPADFIGATKFRV